MLVLSRNLEEEIMIGDTIRVKVLSLADGHVKLGIVAPQEVKVYRAEVYTQIWQQNARAIQATKESAHQASHFLRGKKTDAPKK